MKRVLLLILCINHLLADAQQGGYAIDVTFKPFANQYVYLGNYYGKQLPVVDSLKLDANSHGVFRGDTALPQGIYLVGYPDRSGFFELLIGDQQHFSVMADSSKLPRLDFQKSPDNVLFQRYQEYMRGEGQKMEGAQLFLARAKTAADSAAVKDTMDAVQERVKQYRLSIMEKDPESMLSFLLKAMREPEVKDLKNADGSKPDSAQVYNYYKQHYWDGVEFYDSRLLRTPFFENRLDKYFQQVVYPDPDSTIKEIDWMLSYASINKEMQQFLLTKFVNRYLNMKFMWEDKVFVHLYEKYFSQRTYDWLNEKNEKVIQDRAYSLMANILGQPAADVVLPDTSGKDFSLYDISSPYTMLVIWDPTCGHCKEILPKMDSLYESSWKAKGVKVFALAKQTDGSKADWTDFIHAHQLQEWYNVYYSRDAEKKRVDAGVPGYSQLFDVQSFPTLYLLDENKRIIAKKLTYEQMDDLLTFKTKPKQ